jgi:hypothetical protein
MNGTVLRKCGRRALERLTITGIGIKNQRISNITIDLTR